MVMMTMLRARVMTCLSNIIVSSLAYLHPQHRDSSGLSGTHGFQCTSTFHVCSVALRGLSTRRIQVQYNNISTLVMIKLLDSDVISQGHFVEGTDTAYVQCCIGNSRRQYFMFVGVSLVCGACGFSQSRRAMVISRYDRLVLCQPSAHN